MVDLQRRLWLLVNLALGLAVIVVLLGGWTRLNYAGLGCPDWPGCYGELIVPGDADRLAQIQLRYPEQPIDTYKGWLEMIHRYAAGTLGLVILTISMVSFRLKQQSEAGYLPYILLVLVTVQALFGMWTVTLKLLPQVVTAHLLGGLATLSLIFCLRQRLVVKATSTLKKAESKLSGAFIQRALAGGMLVLVLQLALGGWTSANYAGWSCANWVSCNGSDIGLDFRTGFSFATDLTVNYEGGNLPVEARAAIQVVHRLMAVFLLLYLLSLYLLFRRKAMNLSQPALWVLIIALAQAGLGIANVVWALPLSLATAHHAGAVCLLLAMLWLYQRSHEYSKEVLNEHY